MSPAPSTNSTFDPGLTRQYSGPLLRTINKDGSFNIQRKGLRNLAGSLYIHLASMSWPRFAAWVILAYLLVNSVFAGVFMSLGPEALHATARDMGLGDFGRAFFFSVQTLTTVGYGAV
jgi:inward rectifier potassium channel